MQADRRAIDSGPPGSGERQRDGLAGRSIAAAPFRYQRVLSETDVMLLSERPSHQIQWLSLISSDRDRICRLKWGYREESASHNHRYIGGPPPRRLQRMQVAHEARARRHGVSWDAIDLRDIYAYHLGMCGICDTSVGYEEFTIDHVFPISRGGSHLWQNLQLAHAACNSKKGDR